MQLSDSGSGTDYSHFPKTTRTLAKKMHIPQALKWQLWLTHAGENFKAKCATPWCRTVINVTNFQAGHRLAESKGGPTTLENLVPICALCNQSMGTEHFDVWAGRGQPIKNCWSSLCALFSRRHQQQQQKPQKQPQKQRSQKQKPNNVCDTQADTYHPPLQPLGPPLPQQIVLSNML
jgi:hypothetical protein